MTVDLDTQSVQDAEGRPVELRPQSFAVLQHLIENAGQLVGKEELISAVWPGIAVTDDSLVQCVHEIRRALGDEQRAFLKTVPRRGYRLLLPEGAQSLPAGRSAESPAASPPHPAFRRLAPWAVATLALIALAIAGWFLLPRFGSNAVAARPALAVLPFDNLGQDPTQNYFADGITEDLITDLSKLQGIDVIARNSSWAYRGGARDLSRIAEELGVRYILEGSVRREGEQVRINAQLIDTVGGHHLWAERYDGTLGDIFSVQDKVIANIVSALSVELPAGSAAGDPVPETENIMAYDAMLLGSEHLHRDNPEDTARAISLFEKAVALDPGYSRAYAALAAAYLRVTLSIWYTTAGSGLDRAYEGLRASLAKALENPTPLALRTAAVWYQQTGRIDEAFALIERARAMAPNDPDILVSEGMLLNATGRAVEGEAAIRLAMRLDPAYAPATMRALSMSLFHQERYQEAIDVLARLTTQGTDETNDYLTLVSSLGHLGRSGGVTAAIARFNELANQAAWDPMTVQEAQWYWNVNLFHYYRPYVDKLTEGLRKAGVPEGAGTDLPLERYKSLITRVGEGEFDVEGATEIDVATARAMRDQDVPFVDVRARPDYDHGHVPGAVSLSLVYALSRETLLDVARPDEPVVFYCHSKYCDYSAFAAAKALVWGWQKVYRFSGGFPEWENAGYPVEVSPAAN